MKDLARMVRQFRRLGLLVNVTECVDQLEAFVRAFGITDLVTMAVPPGMPVDALNHSHEQLFKVVVPQLKARLNASTFTSSEVE